MYIEPEYFEDDYYPEFDFMSEQLERDIEEYDRNWFNENENPDDMWDDEWPEPSIADYEQWDREHKEMLEDHPWLTMDCTTIPQNKLESFINDAKSWKHFDTKNGGSEPYRRTKFSAYRGCRYQGNKVERMIAKLVHTCTSVKTVVDKLKNHVDYKHNKTFRKCANFLIADMQAGETWSRWESSEYLRHLEIHDNCLWRKDKMFHYLGFGYTTFIRWTNDKHSIEYTGIEL